jgi:hypothetical protein
MGALAGSSAMRLKKVIAEAQLRHDFAIRSISTEGEAKDIVFINQIVV